MSAAVSPAFESHTNISSPADALPVKAWFSFSVVAPLLYTPTP